MAMAAWSYRVLTTQAYETMLDVRLTQEQRRKEVRIILAAASKHMTDAQRYDVKKAIDRQREELDTKKRGRAAAKMAARPAGAVNAKVIPIRRDG
jgi:hypothetical protein